MNFISVRGAKKRGSAAPQRSVSPPKPRPKVKRAVTVAPTEPDYDVFEKPRKKVAAKNVKAYLPIPRLLPMHTEEKLAAAIPTKSPTKSWADFPEGQDVSPESSAAAEAAAIAAAAPLLVAAKPRDVFSISESPPVIQPTQSVKQSAVQPHAEEELDDNDDPGYDIANPSAVYAHQSGTTAPACADDVQFDLGIAASNPMTG
jgi:hypothetical protein